MSRPSQGRKFRMLSQATVTAGDASPGNSRSFVQTRPHMQVENSSILPRTPPLPPSFQSAVLKDERALRDNDSLESASSDLSTHSDIGQFNYTVGFRNITRTAKEQNTAYAQLPCSGDLEQAIDLTGKNATAAKLPDALQYDDKIAVKEDLASIIARHPLPELRGPKWYNEVRYHVFSVYRILFAFILMLNLAAVFFIGSSSVVKHFTYHDASTAFAANLLVAVLARHEHVVNLIFRTAVSLPHSRSLFIRKHAAKIYCYGGGHSGCGVSAFGWYIVFIVLLIQDPPESKGIQIALVITTLFMLVWLVVMIVMAHPSIRRNAHDAWELSHRYAGWGSVGIAWAQVFIFGLIRAKQPGSAGQMYRLGIILVETPAFWCLAIITGLIIYPWLRTRRRYFKAEKLSNHAMRLYFDHCKVPIGAAIRLSDDPLLENHAFAVIPSRFNTEGYSVIMSNAGDWTDKFINSRDRPRRLWTRGLPTLGVVHVTLLFSPVVVVATGSGIGPILSFLQTHSEWPVRVIWSARSPETTYGVSIIETILLADKDAIIVDTKRTGYPDLPALAYSRYKEIDAEAVVIISNQKVTREVVYTLESRKVPTFGAIFDS